MNKKVEQEVTKKCNYCDNKATHRRTPDLDIEGVYLCDNRDCFAKFYYEINKRGINQ